MRRVWPLLLQHTFHRRIVRSGANRHVADAYLSAVVPRLAAVANVAMLAAERPVGCGHSTIVVGNVWSDADNV